MESSPKCQIKSNGFDLEFKYLLTNSDCPFQFGLLFGYQNNLYQWIAPAKAYYFLEGEYNDLPENIDGNYDYPGIGGQYKQRFKVPYIGISTGFNKQP